MTKEELERKLGQLAYKIGKKQEEGRKLNTELQALQIEANDVATEIEKLGD
jgi:predicted  nucleic acid-binding Zn-ribbon protein